MNVAWVEEQEQPLVEERLAQALDRKWKPKGAKEVLTFDEKKKVADAVVDGGVDESGNPFRRISLKQFFNYVSYSEANKGKLG